MTISGVGFAAVMGAVCLSTTPVWAQEDGGNVRGLPDRLKISVGGLLGEEATGRSFDKQGWFLLNASYDLQQPLPSRFVDFAAFFEAGGTQNRERFDVGRYRSYTRSVYGLGVSATVRVLPPNRHIGVYAMAGVGGYSLGRNVNDIYEYIDYNPYGEDTQEQFTDRLESRTRFTLGYKFGGGIRFGRGVFVEAAYYNFGRLENTDYGGFGLTVGLASIKLAIEKRRAFLRFRRFSVVSRMTRLKVGLGNRLVRCL
jgi:hypothetical protein